MSLRFTPILLHRDFIRIISMLLLFHDLRISMTNGGYIAPN